MANLPQSAVTAVRSWTEGGLANKDRSVQIVTLALTGQGTVANAILASLFGLRVIEEVTSAIRSDNGAIIVASPSADGSQVLLKAAATNAPADYAVTVTLTVKGYR